MLETIIIVGLNIKKSGLISLLTKEMYNNRTVDTS